MTPDHTPPPAQDVVEEIRRYEPGTEYIGTGEYVACMAEDADGEWVSHEDHRRIVAAAEKRAEEAERERDAALEQAGQSQADVAMLADERDELLARLEEAEADRDEYHRLEQESVLREREANERVRELTKGLDEIARALDCVHEQSMGSDHAGSVSEMLDAIQALYEKAARAEQESATACARMREEKAALRAELEAVNAELRTTRVLRETEPKRVDAAERQGYERGRAEERAAVVEWLREQVERGHHERRDLHLLELLAEDIEDGDHARGASEEGAGG